MATRAPSKVEIRDNSEVVANLLGLFRPVRIVWVGRKAEIVKHTLGEMGTYVRHPANGGKAAFLRGIAAAMT